MKTLFSAVIILIIAVLTMALINHANHFTPSLPHFHRYRYLKNKTQPDNNDQITRLSLAWFVNIRNLETQKSIVRRLYTINPHGIFTIGRYDSDDPERHPDLDFNMGLSMINDPDDETYMTVSRDQAIIYQDSTDSYLFENRSRTNCCRFASNRKPVTSTKITEGLKILIGDCYELTFSRSSAFPLTDRKAPDRNKLSDPVRTKIYKSQ